MRLWPFGKKKVRLDPQVALLLREVRWLQDKFDRLLEMQQLSHGAEKETIRALQNLGRRVSRLEDNSDVVFVSEGDDE